MGLYSILTKNNKFVEKDKKIDFRFPRAANLWEGEYTGEINRRYVVFGCISLVFRKKYNTLLCA